MNDPRELTEFNGTSHRMILELLVHGPLSRSELGRRLGLSRPSLTRLAKPLIGSGLVVELPAVRESTLGAPSRPLDIVTDAMNFVGVEVNGNHVWGAATTIRTEVLASEQRALGSTSPADVVEVLVEVAQALAARVPNVLSAIGVSVGGKVGPGGVVESAKYLGWSDVPLQRMLEERTDWPAFVENDLVAWTEAERWFGVGRDSDSFALLTIGVGIGFGLVAHRRVVRSADAGVGLLGHVPLDPFGPLCQEGHRGCASAMLTMDAIASAVSVALGRHVEYDQCLALAREGEPAAVAAVTASGKALGQLIALIANITQVDKVVVSGDGVALADTAEAAMWEGIRANRSPWASPVVVEVDRAGLDQWARAAAAIAILQHTVGEGWREESF